MTVEYNIGDIVTGIYKTGKYIGEITDIRPHHYLVRIKSVLKHPMQGDLHHPKQVNVPIFHERRALALNEQTNIPKAMVKRYEGHIPDYEESLRNALAEMKAELKKDDSEWAKRSLTIIKSLEKEYFKLSSI
jgi:kinase-associated protein B